MNLPAPKPGLVIRYAYLWESEAREGREEGTKDRPCAIVLVVLRDSDRPIVRVLPVTHSPPSHAADALEIPATTKQRLGLDGERSWVVLTEANDFIRPGPTFGRFRVAISTPWHTDSCRRASCVWCASVWSAAGENGERVQ